MKDVGERKEALELAMGYVLDSIEELKGYKDFEIYNDTLSDIWADMNIELSELEREETAKYHELREELTREYWRTR